MISSIQLQGYRGFGKFEMNGLGRLNLLVGTNNSGKTSVLEALYLLNSRGDPSALWQLLWRRGERLAGDRNPRRPQPELDICHLFTGHELQVGARFTVSARNQGSERSISFAVAEVTAKERVELFAHDDDGTLPSRLILQIKGTPAPLVSAVPLSRGGGILTDALEAPRRMRRRTADSAQFVTTESLTGDELVSHWDKIALTPDENLVLKALQFLDPNIERIAAQAANPYFSSPSRGGFIVKSRRFEHPVPIGSMGDGMWRMLAMAIAITQCRNGLLLVDEIDTGLHYTVMGEMWKLIFNAAKEFNVQVFATTHSYDCVYSLACVNDSDPAHPITVQRIEIGKPKAIPYSESEIRVAAEREIEVR